eukprot:IDg19318t1
MCQYCCSHLPARAPADRCGGRLTTSITSTLRVFVLNEPTPFPGELLTLHLWQGGALRLFADVLESVRASEPRDETPNRIATPDAAHIAAVATRNDDYVDDDDDGSNGVSEEPLPGVFGIATTADALHGVIARVDTARPGGWERAARRLHVEVVGRYAKTGISWHTGAYLMAQVTPLCERAAPRPVRLRTLDASFAPLRAPPLPGSSRRRARAARAPPRRRPSHDLGGSRSHRGVP